MKNWEFPDVEDTDTAVDNKSIGGVIRSVVDDSTCDEDGVGVGANVVDCNAVKDEEINGSEVSDDDVEDTVFSSLE